MRKPDESPWYLLATLYSKPAYWGRDVHAKNRKTWNRGRSPTASGTPAADTPPDLSPFKMAVQQHLAHLWLWPRAHRSRPPDLVGARHAQHADIVEMMPDDLQPDRQTVRIVTGADRVRRLLRHVEWCHDSGTQRPPPFERASCNSRLSSSSVPLCEKHMPHFAGARRGLPYDALASPARAR